MDWTPHTYAGFFMYKTITTIKKGFAVVKVFYNGEEWQTYDFPINENFNYVEHLTEKVWGTVGNLSEIKLAIQNAKHRTNFTK